MVELSQEQTVAKDAIVNCKEGEVVAVEAVAGSGKSKLLYEADKYIQGKKLYTTFSKPLITESRLIFSEETEVITFHSFCYDIVIRQGLGGHTPGPRTIGYFNFRNVTTKLLDEQREEVVIRMEEFFGSADTSILKFLKDKEVTGRIAQAVIFYIKQMVDKTRPVTFGFLQKWYHICLSRGLFTPAYYDAIYLDEVQDMEKVGLEIFKLLPAKRKVVVGDQSQAIYASFTQATNGFVHLQDNITKTFPLTRSYRVNTTDAKIIQNFMQEHVKKDFVFLGHDHHNTEIHTTGYITRTNSALIEKMVQLSDEGIEFSLARKVGNLFALVITLVTLKKGNYIEGEYSYLNKDVDHYSSLKPSEKKTKSLLMYIVTTHKSNSAIYNSFLLIKAHGSKKIYSLYQLAKTKEKAKKKADLVIGTIHAFKGLTVDRTVLDRSINLKYLIDPKLSEEEKFQETLLVYTACTRHRIQLDGAEWLNKYKEVK